MKHGRRVHFVPGLKPTAIEFEGAKDQNRVCVDILWNVLGWTQ